MIDWNWIRHPTDVKAFCVAYWSVTDKLPLRVRVFDLAAILGVIAYIALCDSWGWLTFARVLLCSGGKEKLHGW